MGFVCHVLCESAAYFSWKYLFVHSNIFSWFVANNAIFHKLIPCGRNQHKFICLKSGQLGISDVKSKESRDFTKAVSTHCF